MITSASSYELRQIFSTLAWKISEGSVSPSGSLCSSRSLNFSMVYKYVGSIFSTFCVLSYFCLFLQALEGFAFLLNHDGKVEYVTDNVTEFIKFTKDEILGKRIFSIIHPADHGRFSSCLLPTSVSNWNQGGSGGGSNQQPKNSPFNCRMLVKSSEDIEDALADSKEHSYEQLQVCVLGDAKN